MKFNKVFIIGILLIAFSIACVFLVQKTAIPKLRGDSGFDSSYDSGSSWDSGGSSWNSDSSSGGSGGPTLIQSLLEEHEDFAYWYRLIRNIIFGLGFPVVVVLALRKKTTGKLGFFIGVIILYGFAFLFTEFLLTFSIFFVIVLLFMINPRSVEITSNISNISTKKRYVDNKLVEKYNNEEFLKARYDDYLKVQYAWMNFDYDVLKEKLTDELYNQYSMQLDTLKVKNQKNVMSDFEYINSYVTYVNEKDDIISVTLELVVKFYDYIEENGKVVRGNKDRVITQHYEMVFVSSDGPKYCNSCGQELDKTIKKICPSCKSKLIYIPNTWVLSKKRSLEQK